MRFGNGWLLMKGIPNGQVEALVENVVQQSDERRSDGVLSGGAEVVRSIKWHFRGKENIKDI